MSNTQHLAVFFSENRTVTLFARDQSNNVLDITGYTLLWSFGNSPYDPLNNTPIQTQTAAIVDGPSGAFSVTLGQSQTRRKWGDYKHMAIATGEGVITWLNNAGGPITWLNALGGPITWTNNAAGSETVVTEGRLRIMPGDQPG